MTPITLYDWFARSADAHPDATALEAGDTALTYAELVSATGRVAALIADEAGGIPQRIGLLTSRSVTGCMAYLAAQRLGAAVVPLNPGVPAARNLAITTDAALEITIVDDTAGDGLPDYLRGADIAILDMTGAQSRAVLHDLSAPSVSPATAEADDIAYIIFTSGTSGRPKGVPITHANASSFLEAVIPRYGFRPGARVSQAFEMAFDGSILAMFGAWGSGATLCLAARRDVLTPVRFINSRRLTHWLSVPSLISFATRLRALPHGSMPDLELSSFGGEALTLEQVRAWSAAAPNSDIINCYGPTETTVIVTANRFHAGAASRLSTPHGSVPIGAIYPHLEHLLLDDELRPSHEGELCIRGAQRFGGYLDPAENAGRFVTFDGTTAEIYDGSAPLTEAHWYRTGDRIRRDDADLVHIGRVDDQVKVRGHRIELAEIEATLTRHPAIEQAVVMTVVATDGETDLHALYTGTPLEDEALARLVADLPDYMRPHRFHHREQLPLTSVDKVDRRRLALELDQATA